MAAGVNDVRIVQCFARPDKLKKLLEQRNPTLNVNTQDQHGFTALHHAARDGLIESVELLLAHGADADIQSNPKAISLDTTALYLAAKYGHKNCVWAILNTKPLKDKQRFSIYKLTPKEEARKREFPEVVALFEDFEQRKLKKYESVKEKPHFTVVRNSEDLLTLPKVFIEALPKSRRLHLDYDLPNFLDPALKDSYFIHHPNGARPPIDVYYVDAFQIPYRITEMNPAAIRAAQRLFKRYMGYMDDAENVPKNAGVCEVFEAEIEDIRTATKTAINPQGIGPLLKNPQLHEYNPLIEGYIVTALTPVQVAMLYGLDRWIAHDLKPVGQVVIEKEQMLALFPTDSSQTYVQKKDQDKIQRPSLPAFLASISGLVRSYVTLVEINTALQRCQAAKASEEEFSKEDKAKILAARTAEAAQFMKLEAVSDFAALEAAIRKRYRK